jgi:hypothetical protein
MLLLKVKGANEFWKSFLFVCDHITLVSKSHSLSGIFSRACALKIGNIFKISSDKLVLKWRGQTEDLHILPRGRTEDLHILPRGHRTPPPRDG